MKNHPLQLGLLGAMLLSATVQASTDTDYQIESVALRGDSLQLLISEESVRTSCYRGRHSCSEESLGANLYRLIVPLHSPWISFTDARHQWQKVREARQAEDFWGQELAGDALIVFDQTGAAVCPLAQKATTCSAAQDIPAPISQPRPARHDPHLLAANKVYRLPGTQVEHDLGKREGYLRFREAVRRDMRHDGQSAQLVGPVGSRFLVGVEQFAAAGEQPLLAQLYDIENDSTTPVRLVGLPARVTVHSLDVASKDDDVLFLLNLFRYSKENYQLEYSQNIIYSTRQQSWIEIPPFDPPNPRHLLWDVDHARFVEVLWNHQRDGIEIRQHSY